MRRKIIDIQVKFKINKYEVQNNRHTSEVEWAALKELLTLNERWAALKILVDIKILLNLTTCEVLSCH